MIPSLPSSSTSKLYQAGTLSYTGKGVVVLSMWLLWGDFAFTFFESIFSRYLPIYLKDLEASNTLIGLMSGSFAGVVNLLFLPGISRWSDDLRTSIGRRIPLLYVTTPLTVGALVAIGFASEIGDFFYKHTSAFLPFPVTNAGMILGIMCVLTVSYHFFNMVLVNAYNWLIRDVVPSAVMARFLAWFGTIGGVSGMLFLWFVFPKMVSHRHEVFVGIGIFYTFAFFLMCYKVKEGKYPAPAPVEDRPGIFKTYVVYFRECLQIPIYRNFFIHMFVLALGIGSTGNFATLFWSDTLNISLEKMGQVFAIAGGIALVFLYPIGWLCDRFSPFYVYVVALVVTGLMTIAGALLVHNEMGFMIFSFAGIFPTTAFFLAQRTISMTLFPLEKFGQFSGALNVFGCGALILGNFLVGVLMDMTDSNYRMAVLWAGLGFIISLVPLLLVIRGWKQHGGKANYVAPLPD